MKVAVIGVGSMGRNHARVYNDLPEAQLVAVADTNAAIASEVAARYGTRGYADYHEMLDREKPDAVSIVVPTALHEQVALDVLEAGAHILIEKPIAASIAQGQRVIAQARACGRQLMCGHIVRFNPAIQALKQKLRAGQLGRIFQIVCRRIGPFPTRVQDVGVVVDLAPHDLDLMRYITEQNPVRVFAETEQRLHTDHEDLLLGLLRFPDGMTGGLEINWLTPTKVREVIVLGECGMFRVDDLTQDLYFYENALVDENAWQNLRLLKGVSEGPMIRYPIQRYEPLKAELQAFLCAVRGESPVPVTGEDGLAALKLALALVESAERHAAVEVRDLTGG